MIDPKVMVHSVVIMPEPAKTRYRERMHLIASIIFGFVLAALLVIAQPEHASHDVHADVAEASSLIHDAVCGDGSGHGHCQPVTLDPIYPAGFAPTKGTSQYKITAISAGSQALAPTPPPPRERI